MNGNFYIYFDLQKKQEIIKYRKLKRYYIVDTDDSDILAYYNIDEGTNPNHIISKNNFKNTEYSKFVVKTELVDYDAELDIIIQPIGTLLLDFLNIDLSNSRYLKNFILKYGLNIISNLDKSKDLPTYLSYTTKEFNTNFENFYNATKKTLNKIQNDFKNCINFCYFNTDKSLGLLTSIQKYFLSYHACNEKALFTYVPSLEKYSKGISIDFESFFTTDITLGNYTNKELIKKVSDKDFAFSPYSYICTKLENALFLSFINILNIERLEIKTCKNCGKYFIPISKSNEKFCTNYISLNSKKTCRDVGAFNSYNNKVKDNEIETLVRRTSSYFSMQVKRNPDIDIYRKKHEDWKRNYKEQRLRFKNNEITKDEFINWINLQRR